MQDPYSPDQKAKTGCFSEDSQSPCVDTLNPGLCLERRAWDKGCYGHIYYDPEYEISLK